MAAVRKVFVGLVTVALAACGGGGGSSSAPPPSPPPATASYPAPPLYTRSVAIAPLVPTINGTVTAFAVSPALPAGLTLNTSNGQISGTPTAVAAAASYSVTATSAGGTSTTAVNITVNDTLPDVAYARSNYSLTTEVPVDLTPTSTGGAVTQWSIDTALPAGLALDTATGKISGTPSQAAVAHSYVVTARNSGGTDTFGITLAVQSGFLLDVGHFMTIEELAQDGNRIMSADENRASLWDAQSGTKLAAVDTCAAHCIALQGPTAVFLTFNGFTVLDSSDAHLLAQFDFAQAHLGWWTLGADGSYLCAGTNTSLNCWSRTGAQLFTKSGNYSSAKVFADAGELRIANGAAGNQVIEKLALPGGASSLTPAFAGAFASWFRDGQRFLTTASLTVGVYTKDGTQVELKTLPSLANLGAQHDWIWIATANGLELYRVGGGAAPIANLAMTGYPVLPDLQVGDDTIALTSRYSNRIGIIDLSVPTPSRVDFTSPSTNISAFAANSANDWTFGTLSGVVFGELNQGPPQHYALGAVTSITASATRFAVATSANRILIFSSATRQLEDFIDVDASKVEISSDGTRLAAGPNQMGEAGHSLRIYELPAKNVLAQWISNPGDTSWLYDFSFARGGQTVGRINYVGPSLPLTRVVTRLDGTPLWTDNGSQPIRLSPDGNHIAVSSGERVYTTGTNVYVNGALTAALSGWTPGWLDDSRVLDNRYINPPRPSVPPFQDAAIFDAAGQTLATPPLPELWDMQPVDSNTLYSSGRNQIYDATTGALLWSTPTLHLGPGAVAGSSVIFADYSAAVRAEAR